MTNRLAAFRSQLAGLRRTRGRSRAASAYSAAGVAIILALLAVLLLDWLFQLGVRERMVVMLLATAAAGWAIWRFSWPLLRVREDEIEMALLVERQQRIDSDLVAALQFDAAHAAAWGSPQLTSAVVDYVAAAGRGIDVFQGSPQSATARRLLLLAVCSAALIAGGLLWPEHLLVFANRMLLGSRHYPTRTKIEQVAVNHAVVLDAAADNSQPAQCQAPQGRSLAFLVQCSGEHPAEGAVQIAALAARHTHSQVSLKPLTMSDRLARLEQASRKLNDTMAAGTGAVTAPWREAVETLVRFDAPQSLSPLAASKTHADLPAVAQAVREAIERWPGDRDRTALYVAELPRLNDPLTYKVKLGDAWTDAATIAMIPLPVVEMRMKAVPPPYARSVSERVDPSFRQIAVLQGSAIQLEIACLNQKRLASAWINIASTSGNQRLELVPRGEDKLTWSLPHAASSPLGNIQSDLRYEIQVVDADGLSLDTPLAGSVRIRPDRLPTGSAEIVHRIVLPTAEPVIEYRAGDDYGISRLAVVVEIERGAPRTAAAKKDDAATGSDMSLTPAEAVPMEAQRFDIPLRQSPLRSSSLPLTGQYALPLAPLALVKGDRLKLTLEVTDYRGENAAGQATGMASASDPLLLEISDESGVLAAIGEADQRSEERLTDMIKRQLGIGEEP